MHLTGDPVIFRGKPYFNYVVIDVNDDDPSNPKYMIADSTTDRPYSFWVPDEDLENVLENPS